MLFWSIQVMWQNSRILFPQSFLLFTRIWTHSLQKVKLGIPMRPEMGKQNIQANEVSLVMYNQAFKGLRCKYPVLKKNCLNRIYTKTLNVHLLVTFINYIFYKFKQMKKWTYMYKTEISGNIPHFHLCCDFWSIKCNRKYRMNRIVSMMLHGAQWCPMVLHGCLPVFSYPMGWPMVATEKVILHIHPFYPFWKPKVFNFTWWLNE